MKFLSLLATATAVTAWSIPNPWSPIPGYPMGNTVCLSDAQANFLVQTFSTMLSNPDRSKTQSMANVLLDNSYTESSDSINQLAGFPVCYLFSRFCAMTDQR